MTQLTILEADIETFSTDYCKDWLIFIAFSMYPISLGKQSFNWHIFDFLSYDESKSKND